MLFPQFQATKELTMAALIETILRQPLTCGISFLAVTEKRLFTRDDSQALPQVQKSYLYYYLQASAQMQSETDTERRIPQKDAGGNLNARSCDIYFLLRSISL